MSGFKFIRNPQDLGSVLDYWKPLLTIAKEINTKISICTISNIGGIINTESILRAIVPSTFVSF